MDRPILFSGPMVRAILAGRKTMTRRVLKPQPFPVGGPFYRPRPVDSPYLWHSVSAAGNMANIQTVAYAPGDRLWVREKWQGLSFGDYAPTKFQPCDLRYAATDSLADTDRDVRGYPWRPSIHMPRWASHLTLIVTDVRIQRLQEISAADARAEGVRHNNAVDPRAPKPLWDVPGTGFGGRHPQEAFAALWDSLNAQRAPWDSNPWVCAVSFEAHKINIDQMEADHG